MIIIAKENISTFHQKYMNSVRFCQTRYVYCWGNNKNSLVDCIQMNILFAVMEDKNESKK